MAYARRRPHPSPRRTSPHLHLVAAAAALLLGGCYTQHHFFEPAMVPQGAEARPVQLVLNRPVSVTGTITDSRRPAEPPHAVHVPAATRIVGRVRWSSADSIEVEPRDAYDGRSWQSVAGVPPIRLAWRDLARAEERQLSPGRTLLAVVVSTLVVAAACAAVGYAIVMTPSDG